MCLFLNPSAHGRRKNIEKQRMFLLFRLSYKPAADRTNIPQRSPFFSPDAAKQGPFSAEKKAPFPDPSGTTEFLKRVGGGGRKKRPLSPGSEVRAEADRRRKSFRRVGHPLQVGVGGNRLLQDKTENVRRNTRSFGFALAALSRRGFAVPVKEAEFTD
ncbi:hypothetical protein CDAR_589101 [Caerostris darwini]|uniref:Uncharacterized protein n=1 Tax=Caerostris darwini TaxID=1538125 RepID=A0AAV4T9H9_9ARAC|nr:hypothetical protein CDAR_589101 [Caerostris darwini]